MPGQARRIQPVGVYDVKVTTNLNRAPNEGSDQRWYLRNEPRASSKIRDDPSYPHRETLPPRNPVPDSLD
jgi:hypothetical protein